MTAPVVERVRAGLLLDGVGQLPLAGVDVRLADGAVVGVGPAGPGPFAVGGEHSLVLPALANAHDHGRGISTLAFGLMTRMRILTSPAAAEPQGTCWFLVA